jgi:hypothetical protein
MCNYGGSPVTGCGGLQGCEKLRPTTGFVVRDDISVLTLTDKTTVGEYN